jgi:hypothetical protein
MFRLEFFRASDGARDHLAKRVHRAQQHRDGFFCNGQDVIAQPLEQLLEGVCKLRDFRKSQARSVAFDRVSSTKDCFEKFLIVGVGLKADQRLFHSNQVFFRFGYIGS